MIASSETKLASDDFKILFVLTQIGAREKGAGANEGASGRKLQTDGIGGASDRSPDKAAYQPLKMEQATAEQTVQFQPRHWANSLQLASALTDTVHTHCKHEPYCRASERCRPSRSTRSTSFLDERTPTQGVAGANAAVAARRPNID
jgi:hypothetical protein